MNTINLKRIRQFCKQNQYEPDAFNDPMVEASYNQYLDSMGMGYSTEDIEAMYKVYKNEDQ